MSIYTLSYIIFLFFIVFFATKSCINVVVKAESVGRALILVLFPTLIRCIFIYAFTTRELERGCRIIFVSLIGVTFILCTYMHAVLC